MNKMLIINSLFSLLIIFVCHLAPTNCLATCTDRCKANSTHPAECLRKARTNLTLECTNYDIVNFVRNYDNKTIFGFNVQFFSDNFNYSAIDGSFNQILINSLRGVDSGKKSFQAFNIKNRDNPCTYNIHVYDTDNDNGIIKFGSTTWQISSENSLSFNIDSYKQNLNFTFKYEALPMDYLLVNGQKKDGNKCKTKNYYWLNCYESDLLLNIQKCQNNVRYNLSYGFENSESYQGCEQRVPIRPKIYEKSINILYPPMVENNLQLVHYSDFKQEVELECKVQCANPSTLTYSWSADGEILQPSITLSELSHKFKYKIDAESTDDIFEVICTVTNGQNSDNSQFKNDSQTIFRISYKSADDSNWPLWLIIIVSVVSLILVVIVITLMIFVCRRSDTNDKTTNKNPTRVDKTTSIIEMESNRNSNVSNKKLRDQQSDNLTSNPVYGDVNLKVMNQQRKSKEQVLNENETSNPTINTTSQRPVNPKEVQTSLV